MPIPEGASLAELNAMIDEWDVEDEGRRIAQRIDAFETERWFAPRVDRYTQIAVRMNRYSVPARLVGRQVRVLLHASELRVFTAATKLPGMSA